MREPQVLVRLCWNLGDEKLIKGKKKEKSKLKASGDSEMTSINTIPILVYFEQVLLIDLKNVQRS